MLLNEVLGMNIVQVDFQVKHRLTNIRVDFQMKHCLTNIWVDFQAKHRITVNIGGLPSETPRNKDIADRLPSETLRNKDTADQLPSEAPPNNHGTFTLRRQFIRNSSDEFAVCDVWNFHS